jgi:hypothetical protein
MKARLPALLTLLGALAFLTAVAILLSPRRPQTDRATYDSLAEGMTRREVEALLGRPRNGCGGGATVWVRRDGKLVSADLRRDLTEMTFFPDQAGGEAAWASEAGLIAVRFGPDGRLQARYFSEVHLDGGPTVRQGLARLFAR